MTGVPVSGQIQLTRCCRWCPKVRACHRDGRESVSWMLALTLSMVSGDEGLAAQTARWAGIHVLDLGLEIVDGGRR